MEEERMDKILNFLKEIEKFKSIERTIVSMDSDRMENDAEHSWHLAMFILLFEKEFEGLDILRMLKMALIHDLIEIYAGDTCAYDDKGRETKEEREKEAEDKLFSQLPEDLAKEFRELYHEYNEKKTKEAELVKSFDKLQPIVQNLSTNGKTWKKLGPDYERVNNYKKPHMLHDPLVLEIYEKIMKEVKDKKLLS